MNTIKINAKVAKMIAHRGVSGIERENNCPAFVAAQLAMRLRKMAGHSESLVQRREI